MAQSWTEICVFLVSVSMLWRGAVAQPSCTNVLLSMASCLNFVTGSSSSPSSSCCSSFARVVQSQPQCLCTALNGGGSSLGVNINQTLALALPGACNVQTPPVSRCNDANGQTVPPLGSPETSPAGFPDETPDSPATGSSFSGGSKAVPSNAATNSDGNTLKTPLQLAAFLVFAASYASISSKL